ncbi:alpha/beta fold hydrolase [Kordiimonas sp. SCSIO 12610]|uniref:alpha/beta fold hydrolase n=1 Tax=Kordiimonas sp. SCSIO 12610 TaxID=2829597 RepID=UPI00210AD725|nr:alpha/beta hydrolase [Kordiimonas sp. SCSIO 12610]UTW54807.1 alpha/beta hydrolase [Kordiimonas sp. SCSIO 12610]
MWIRVLLLCVVAGLLAACQPESPLESRNSVVPRFETVKEDGDFPVKIPSAFDATLGWLVIAEDRNNAQSPEIRLPVAIIHTSAKTSKSPVVYLSGGPGTSAMRTAAFPGAYPWLKERDFIVIGQRGTHYAKPALMCPEYRNAVEKGTDLVASVKACKARLTQDGIGLKNYNSLTSAADLEDLRTVLGIDTWNLYGVSYGTRLGLIYAKNHGGSLDAMVLDSPLPPNAIYDDQSAKNLENTLRNIAKDCASQPSCNNAFPNLEQRFFQTIDAIVKSPLEIDGLNQPVTAPELVSLVPLNSGNDVRRAPLFMDYLARFDPVIQGYLDSPAQASDLAWGMRFSVWCSEALPFSKRSRMEKPGPVLGGYESAAITPELCQAWRVPSLDQSVVEPVISDVPTLIFAGDFDPLTPPIWGELAANTLSKSLVVTVRGGGHSTTQQWGGDGCAMALANDFIKEPESVLAADKSDYCVFERSAPSYMLQLD